MGKRLGLPTHAYMGLSDSKCPDYQAGLESGVGTILAALAGINVVSGPGMLDFEICQSFEKLLLDHDACGMALRLVRGIERREEGAVDLIRQVVESAEFLSHPHTRKHWREELTVASPLVARDTYGDWEARGAPRADEVAAKEVERRLSKSPPRPPAADVTPALDEIMRREARAAGLSELPAIELRLGQPEPSSTGGRSTPRRRRTRPDASGEARAGPPRNRVQEQGVNPAVFPPLSFWVAEERGCCRSSVSIRRHHWPSSWRHSAPAGQTCSGGKSNGSCATNRGLEPR